MADEPHGLYGHLARVGSHIIVSLKTEFLALVLINAIFLGLFVWYINARADHANAVMQQLLDACLQHK